MGETWCQEECGGAGWCPRFGRHMTAHLVRLCRTDKAHRAMFARTALAPSRKVPGTAATPLPAEEPVVGLNFEPSRAADRPATPEQFAELRLEILDRPEVGDDPALRQRVELRLDVCARCPDDALVHNMDQGTHCRQFCQGCAANWHLLLVKRLTGGLRREVPCRHWPVLSQRFAAASPAGDGDGSPERWPGP